jgi:transposase
MECIPKSKKLPKKRYPSDVEDAEWEFIAPYLARISPESPQRKHNLREVFNALRYLVRTGVPWRYLPDTFPPWEAVYQQTQRWIAAQCFEQVVDDLRMLLREAQGRDADPTRTIVDSQTLQGSIESGERAGYDAGKKKKGSKVHIAVDTLGHLVSLLVTPASVQDREMIAAIANDIQEVTGDGVEVMYADSGYSGEDCQEAARGEGMELVVVKRPAGAKGFVLLPKRWVVERSFGWKSRFRRLVRDYERLPETVAGLHFCAFAILMLTRLLGIPMWSA